MICCNVGRSTSTACTPAARAVRSAWIGHARSWSLAIVACMALASCVHRGADRATAAAWADARQLLLVTTPHWDATDGTLQAYARVDGAWVAHGAPARVAVGRSGSAWGLGLHPTQRGTQKREGDGRAPAGVFAIGEAFGHAPSQSTALRYRPMTADDWCIDVPASPLYNRIVDGREVGAAAIEGSTEPMRRDIHLDGDQRYRRGFVIAHNAAGIPNAGSCIFAHLWQTPGQATAGCTAMPEPAMQALLGWLDPAQRPVFVLLPEAEHARLETAWGLPARGAFLAGPSAPATATVTSNSNGDSNSRSLGFGLLRRDAGVSLPGSFGHPWPTHRRTHPCALYATPPHPVAAR